MENLITTCKILIDQDYLNIKKELILLKKATAAYGFLEDLQENLDHVNNDIVQCACDRCVSTGGGNYPKTGPNRRLRWLIASEEKINRVEIKDCLLYKWFKDKCTEYKVPLPDDLIDHPSLHDGLSLVKCLHTKNSQTSWMRRITSMSFADQTKTLYPMLHFMESIGDEEAKKETFAEWFTIKGICLL